MRSTVSAWALSCTLTLVLGAVIGCAKPAATPGEKRSEAESDDPAGPAATAPSESAKTRELEEKAAGYEERFKDIQTSDLSPEQKAQAAGELVDEQQRTVREAQDGPEAEAPADPQ